jgi:hypothetical protein
MFINGINTIYVTNPNYNTILIWPQGSTTSSSVASSKAYSIFVTINGDIYIDNGYSNGRVDKRSYQSNSSEIVMNVNGSCYGLFVDNNNTLYCSLTALHEILQISLGENNTIPMIRAGTGSSGSTSDMLNSPHGIYVDFNLTLYVADCRNNRIQLFQSEESNGTTIAGGNISSETISLNCPTDVILDVDNNLFIVDSGNNRIIGSGSNGFRCIAGCLGSSVPSSFKLSNPQSMAFDSYGNIFVSDTSNSRIQTFFLANNCSGK